ncbi:MAG: hypothetical protein JWO92_1132 [Chitinophagaceae bacterium]|nr:hypothetical protein [Chitinophagaceae bacterium]
MTFKQNKSGESADLGEPAAYPSTSPTEIRSTSTLMALLDPRFIKAEIKTMDKVPNTDGVIIITNEAQVPLGKFEIQVKTLETQDFVTPKHQCTKKFLAFCQSSTLAVILVAVDNENNVAYWKHMDSESIADAKSRITGESVSVLIPVENKITKNGLDYVHNWTTIVRSVKAKLDQHDQVAQENKDLQKQLQEVLQRLEPASILSAVDIREIHLFLDHLNYILDYEFRAVKIVKYPDYWKIGIGIFKYTDTSCSFFLYPLEYTRNETLMKEYQGRHDTDINTIFHKLNALLYATGTEVNYIRYKPWAYAYKTIQSDVERLVGNYNFPIDDEFLAHEYLYAFVQKFHVYFGLETQALSYSIDELRELLNKILPVEIELNHTWQEGLTEFEMNIDSDMDHKPSPMFLKRIMDAKKKIEQGYQSKIKISLRSEKLNLNLINYYLDYLNAKDIKEIKKVYIPMVGKPIVNFPSWAAWDQAAVIENLKVFTRNFRRLYKSCLLRNFPLLEQQLDIFENYDLLIYVVRFSPEKKHKPYLEFYEMRSEVPVEKTILVFGPDDPDCPVDRYQMYENKDWTCIYNNVKYKAVVVGNRPIDFLFEPSPSYALINIVLAKKVKEYLKEKTKN